MQELPPDIELHAARLHDLLAPGLLQLLDSHMDKLALRQEQFLHTILNEARTNSGPKHEPGVGTGRTIFDPCGSSCKSDDNSKEHDMNNWRGGMENNGNQPNTSNHMAELLPEATLDENQIQSALSGKDVGSYGTSVHDFFSRFKEDITRPFRPGVSYRATIKGIVDSRLFMLLCGLVMVCHGGFMASSTNMAMKDALSGRSHDPSHTMRHVNMWFGSFYTVELALRLLAEGRAFFTNRDYLWNIFDVFMVALVLEEVLQSILIMEGSEDSNAVFMRLFRLLKLLRAFRFVRLLRSFRELRLMIGSILGCVKSMLWAMVLLSLITFLFGLFFVQACVSEMAFGSSIDSQSRDGIVHYWASIETAMNSLILAGTGGDSWRYMADPLLKVSPLAYGGFLIYIIFFLFVITNTLTSLFIDSYMDSSAKDDSLVIQEQTEKRKELIERIVKVSREVDQDESGVIDISEFDAVCKNPQLIALMDSLSVDPANVREFFDMLSKGGQRPVTIEQFVHGCMKIRGPARSVDVVVVIELLRFIEESQSKFMHYCRVQFDELQCRLPSTDFAI